MTGEGPDSADTDDAGTEPSGTRSGGPLLAGAIGLLAGLAGGIVATTIAPGNLFLTLLLVIVVMAGVTLGTLRLLARRTDDSN